MRSAAIKNKITSFSKSLHEVNAHAMNAMHWVANEAMAASARNEWFTECNESDEWMTGVPQRLR